MWRGGQLAPAPIEQTPAGWVPDQAHGQPAVCACAATQSCRRTPCYKQAAAGGDADATMSACPRLPRPVRPREALLAGDPAACPSPSIDRRASQLPARIGARCLQQPHRGRTLNLASVPAAPRPLVVSSHGCCARAPPAGQVAPAGGGLPVRRGGGDPPAAAGAPGDLPRPRCDGAGMQGPADQRRRRLRAQACRRCRSRRRHSVAALRPGWRRCSCPLIHHPAGCQLLTRLQPPDMQRSVDAAEEPLEPAVGPTSEQGAVPPPLPPLPPHIEQVRARAAARRSRCIALRQLQRRPAGVPPTHLPPTPLLLHAVARRAPAAAAVAAAAVARAAAPGAGLLRQRPAHRAGGGGADGRRTHHSGGGGRQHRPGGGLVP